MTLTSGPVTVRTAGLARRRRVGPARVADVVDRVDEQQVLHVGELVQHGRLEGGRVPGRLDLTDRRRRPAVRSSRMDQSLVEQPLDPLLHRLPALLGGGPTKGPKWRWVPAEGSEPSSSVNVGRRRTSPAIALRPVWPAPGSWMRVLGAIARSAAAGVEGRSAGASPEPIDGTTTAITA